MTAPATTPAVVPDVVDLDDPRATDPAVTGAKGAGLARLRAGGFDVPDGVVLSVGIAEAWASGPAPDDVRSAVATACATLGGPLAVRTSATWEDGATSAHAGATATVLDVDGVDDTLAAIRHCLDESARAERTHGTTGEIAIVVQRLVLADWAGVAFTADPVTGERDVVRVAATPGLGEALVQGEVVGTDVTVRGLGAADGAADGAGGRGRAGVEGDLAGMSPDLAREVAAVARRVEDHFGRPQDIEWTAVGDRVRLVQARPITVLPVAPTPPEGNNWQKDTAHYPEPLTPFGWSLMHACQAQVRTAFDDMGLLVRGLEERFVGGEVYGRVLPAFGSPDGAGSPPPALVLGIAARLVPELRRRTATARQALAEDRMQSWVDDWHTRDRAAMAARTATLGAVDLTGLDDEGLVAHLDRALDHVRDGHLIHFRLVMPLFARMYRLHRLVGDELGWDDHEIATMLGGHSPATRAAEEAMAVLRRRVRATPGAVAALRDEPARPVEVLAAIDPSLGRDLADWMAEHGWALINYDAGVPVLAERPTMVTRLVLAEPEPVDLAGADEVAARARAALPAARRAEFDRALADARAIYPVREDNTIIVGDRPMALVRRIMLEAGRRLAAAGRLAAADDAAYLFVDELRAALAALAGDTAAGGAGSDRPDLGELVATRRGEEAWVRANPGPAHVGEQAPPPDISRLPRPLREVNEPILWGVGHEYPAPAEAPADADVLLAGVPASPGTAEGPVRVIRGHDDLHRLVDGDVLVCQVTSPAWAPLFPLASAVVADGGGVLSHAAIASREHGLPAVLGTGNGTEALVDGQRVLVDGTRGLVRAVED